MNRNPLIKGRPTKKFRRDIEKKFTNSLIKMQKKTQLYKKLNKNLIVLNLILISPQIIYFSQIKN